MRHIMSLRLHPSDSQLLVIASLLSCCLPGGWALATQMRRTTVPYLLKHTREPDVPGPNLSLSPHRQYKSDLMRRRSALRQCTSCRTATARRETDRPGRSIAAGVTVAPPHNLIIHRAWHCFGAMLSCMLVSVIFDRTLDHRI